ncbi:YozE family protein [Jeotgalibaca sp. MA1X17-3]|uniref:YozE family protein n=1 Tax=Jeotgalibaca sp. MA1X17-3 TaxID=2908211 RepID=UPI001F4068B1|nr:YozE family protein [Jeotgalibaca sp. MA1X17-3]UJF14792.1 YozE family protein [Jeotgalibaca sp. MA1X17-3]
MDQTFFNFAMNYRDPHKTDGITRFANQLDKDIGFPRDHSNYHDLADYLEISGEYLNLIEYFDELYEVYQERKEQSEKIISRKEEI